MRRSVLVVLLAVSTILVLMTPAVAGATGTSPIDAGYVAHTVEKSLTFDGSVNVPDAKCLNKQGLDGYLTTTIALTGPSGDGIAQISTSCPDGKPVYEATVLNSLGTSVSEPVSAGDTVTFAATINTVSASYTLTDSTSGPISLDGPGFSTTAIQATQEGQAGPFPKFAALKFGPISVNGTSWDGLDPMGFDEVDGSTVQLKVGALRRDGAFTVKYVSQG